MFLIWCRYGQGDKAHVRLPNTSTFIFKGHFHAKEVTVSCTFLCNNFLEDMPVWSSTPSVQNLVEKAKASKTLEQPGVLSSSQPPTAGSGCRVVYPDWGSVFHTFNRSAVTRSTEWPVYQSLYKSWFWPSVLFWTNVMPWMLIQSITALLTLCITPPHRCSYQLVSLFAPKLTPHWNS